jgi:hypothetical protein
MLRLWSRLADESRAPQCDRRMRPYLAERLLRPVLLMTLLIAVAVPPALADHWDERDYLIQLANETAQDPEALLGGLRDIHVFWHGQRLEERTYGFLLFHYRVVRYFNGIVNSRREEPLAPYSPTEFQRMGVPPFPEQIVGNIQTVRDLALFSRAFELWHNLCHEQMERATGAPLMDAAKNIYWAEFWRLHLYVDRIFHQALAQFANGSHPGEFRTVLEVVTYIEEEQDGWVPYI